MPIIRAATREDLPRIHAIRHGVTENRLSDPSKVAEGEVLWYLNEAIFLVSEQASDGGPVQGLVQGFLCANHQTALIWGLFVDPLAQGRGHGSLLLGAALDRLKALGHLQAWLTTGQATKAEGFYRRHGFACKGTAFSGEAVYVKRL